MLNSNSQVYIVIRKTQLQLFNIVHRILDNYMHVHFWGALSIINFNISCATCINQVSKAP
jgi:hypothetical protein